MTSDAIIDVRDLSKVYPDGTQAVQGVTFQVGRGEFFGFLGPNGAGKSTTIRMLITLLDKTSGEARVFADLPSCWERWASPCYPVTYAIDSMRVLLNGANAVPDEQPGPLVLRTVLILGLLAALTLTLAVRSFRQSLR